MNSKIFTFLLVIFIVIFNNSCSSEDEVQSTPTNISSQNPPQNSNKVLKFIKSTNNNITQYFQSSNGKIILWNTNYNISYNGSIHSITYNSMGKIDKILTSNSPVNEVQFKYDNSLLSEILQLYKDTNGNISSYKSCIITYNNSKVHRLIKTEYITAQDYIDDVLKNCNIMELQFSGENVSKAISFGGQFSRATGVINAQSNAHVTRLYTYNNSILNPYSTFPIEFQVYLALEDTQYNADYFSKNAKNGLKTYTYQSLFSDDYFTYETEANLNGLPNKINSNNGNFGSKATFEYDSY